MSWHGALVMHSPDRIFNLYFPQNTHNSFEAFLSLSWWWSQFTLWPRHPQTLHRGNDAGGLFYRHLRSPNFRSTVFQPNSMINNNVNQIILLNFDVQMQWWQADKQTWAVIDCLEKTYHLFYYSGVRLTTSPPIFDLN